MCACGVLVDAGALAQQGFCLGRWEYYEAEQVMDEAA